MTSLREPSHAAEPRPSRPRGHVLLVEDDQPLRELLVAELAAEGFRVTACAAAEDALAELARADIDVTVTDLQLRGMSGTALCERAQALRPDVLVVVITAFGSLDTAVAAIRAGAWDFLTKPFETGALLLILERALEHRALRLEVRRLQQAVADTSRFGDLLGKSPPMQAIYELLTQLAASDVSVLVTGESGTGKELVARALHERSERRDAPLVTINCSAVPETLLEAQLFGHVKGAYTDARSSRPGLFLQADKGTLFLDEIGDMPIALQPKLLRALQERRVLPVGGDRELPFDVRMVAATHRDLEEAIQAGRFREDLYYRLNVVEVELPPLRARGSDVLLLAQRFVERIAARMGKPVVGISPAAAERLLAYGWPGNVRELQNCIERAVALTHLDHIAMEDLPERVRSYRASQIVVDTEVPASFIPLEELERRYILRVVEACAGARKKAARVLGIDRKTLYRKLVRYGAAEPGDEDSE